MRVLFTVAAIALALSGCQQQPSEPAAVAPTPAVVPAPRAPVVPTANEQFSPAITAEDFAARLKKLASDSFEGRQPGTLGERMTTTWIKDQFERIGLQPGNQGSWYQTVPMMETTLVEPEKSKLRVHSGDSTFDLSLGSEVVFGSLDASPQVDLKDSGIVFVGYGVNAPGQNWNDYAGIDVKGKTVIVLVNDPGWGNQDPDLFGGRALTYFGRWTYKYEEAARQGAAAAFIVHEDGGAGYPWSVVENGWTGPQAALPPTRDGGPRLQSGGWLTTAAAERLFAAAGQDFLALKKSADLRGFQPSVLDASLSLNYRSKIDNGSSENVIGYLKGSTRPDEVIVYTAHWDHLGMHTQLKDDPIFNGAIDNASGVAAIMEIAEAFANQPTPPERSVVFIALTLEESGLLGSAWYVAHPSFPLAKTVANINLDALPIIGPTRNITVIGHGQSELDDYIERAARAQDRVVAADESPEKGFFFRSDHVSFARAGVPALYARAGLDHREGGETVGRAAYEDYISNRYHKPSDEYDPNWDFRGVIEDIQALYAVGSELASETRYPQWKAVSDFQRPAASKGN